MPKITLPPDFLCPITHELMKDPVSTADGQVYERSAIENWLKTHDTSPLTNTRLEYKRLRVSRFVKNEIEDFLKEKKVCTPETFAKVIAAVDEKALASLSYLAEYLELKDAKGHTPLTRAVLSNRLEMVNLLLMEGADREAKDTDGHTPLSWAASLGQLATVEALLRAGADREAKGTDGKTPLCWAALYGQVATVEALLRAGADREAKGMDGKTPLCWAAFNGQVAIVKALLKAGANVAIVDTDGCTPLHLSAKALYRLNYPGRYEQSLIALLAQGANPLTLNRAGYTAIGIASHAGHKDLAVLIHTQAAIALSSRQLLSLHKTIEEEAKQIAQLKSQWKGLQTKLEALTAGESKSLPSISSQSSVAVASSVSRAMPSPGEDKEQKRPAAVDLLSSASADGARAPKRARTEAASFPSSESTHSTAATSFFAATASAPAKAAPSSPMVSAAPSREVQVAGATMSLKY